MQTIMSNELIEETPIEVKIHACNYVGLLRTLASSYVEKQTKNTRNFYKKLLKLFVKTKTLDAFRITDVIIYKIDSLKGSVYNIKFGGENAYFNFVKNITKENNKDIFLEIINRDWHRYEVGVVVVRDTFFVDIKIKKNYRRCP